VKAGRQRGDATNGVLLQLDQDHDDARQVQTETLIIGAIQARALEDTRLQTTPYVMRGIALPLVFPGANRL
jgi:hypothetical protein